MFGAAITAQHFDRITVERGARGRDPRESAGFHQALKHLVLAFEQRGRLPFIGDLENVAPARFADQVVQVAFTIKLFYRASESKQPARAIADLRQIELG